MSKPTQTELDDAADCFERWARVLRQGNDEGKNLGSIALSWSRTKPGNVKITVDGAKDKDGFRSDIRRVLALAALSLLVSCRDCDASLLPYCPEGEPCGETRGACEPGRTACDANGESSCTGALGPTLEVCDGVDNDCDGFVDDELPRRYPSNPLNTCAPRGLCVYAYQRCDGANGFVCDYIRPPTPEVCNGLDDDCDGVNDNGLEAATFYYPDEQYPDTVGVGECRPGIKRCTDGVKFETAAVVPHGELCGNNLDDDCDGLTDETESGNPFRAIVLVEDVSGSMVERLAPLADTICTFQSDPLFNNTVFAVVLVAKGSFQPFVAFMQDFSDATTTCDTLRDPALDDGAAGNEYMIEGILTAGALDWPDGSQHHVIAFTDETIQIFTAFLDDVEDDCLERPYRLGVFTMGAFYFEWNYTTQVCGGYTELLDSTPAHMAQVIRDRFAEGC